ncbi:MAG: hypothetical protein RLZZ337_1745 [Bacteroidota bacterium]|jgi:large-conductance mechanosensitive channel
MKNIFTQQMSSTTWEMLVWNGVQILIIAVAVFFIIRFVRKKRDDID